MTNSNGDRKGRIEDELDAIKEILFTVARRYEVAADRMDATDERLERLAQTTDERINRMAQTTDERINRMAQTTDERIDRLAQKQQRTQEQLDALREDVDIAFQTISLMAENTDREMAEFRSAMLGLQTENRRIWEYLMGQQRNGNGDRT